MIVRKTRPEEGQRVNELFAIAFEQPVENGPADPENDAICHWAAFEEETGEMMSTLSVSDFSVQFDGHACKMGGMGGAATLPQYRRNGGIRGCFHAALPDMYASGYDFSYLYPFSTAYYRKFGYECCVQTYHATLQLSLLAPPPVEGTFRLADGNHPMTGAIRTIDSLWEERFNMMVLHREEDYGWTGKSDPARRQEFTYVYFSPEGTPKGYTTFTKADQSDGRNLVCSRFFFADREGFAGLMHLFKSLASDHRYVKFTVPALPAMQYLMPEWSLGAARWEVRPAGMVRVVRVEDVLKKARYRGSGAVTLKILDPQIPENNASFAVRFQKGRGISVEKTTEPPDACLSIPTFSALITGVCDFDEGRDWLGGLEVRNPDACFSQVFYRKKLMIVDYF